MERVANVKVSSTQWPIPNVRIPFHWSVGIGHWQQLHIGNTSPRPGRVQSAAVARDGPFGGSRWSPPLPGPFRARPASRILAPALAPLLACGAAASSPRPNHGSGWCRERIHDTRSESAWLFLDGGVSELRWFAVSKVGTRPRRVRRPDASWMRPSVSNPCEFCAGFCPAPSRAGQSMAKRHSGRGSLRSQIKSVPVNVSGNAENKVSYAPPSPFGVCPRKAHAGRSSNSASLPPLMENHRMLRRT